VDNQPAIRMYLKHGFAIRATIEGYYGADRHAYVMEKAVESVGRRVRVPISGP
jgi:ribosomal protein S18 acetylase RimI-like enzyme